MISRVLARSRWLFAGAVLVNCGGPLPAEDQKGIAKVESSFTVDPNCTKSWSECNFPPDVLAATNAAKAIMEGLGTVFSEVDTAAKVLRFLGIFGAEPTQQQLLDALYNQIVGLVSGVTWQFNASTWAMRIGPVQGLLDHAIAINRSDPTLAANGQPLIPLTSPEVGTNLTGPLEEALGDPTTFLRTFAPAATDGRWKSIFTATPFQVFNATSPPVTNGLVYDWRIGLPSLMQIITLAVQGMGVTDPNFKNDDVWDDALRKYRGSLEAQFNNILSNVHCARNRYARTFPLYPEPVVAGAKPLPVAEACADLATGMQEVADVDPSALAPDCLEGAFTVGYHGIVTGHYAMVSEGCDVYDSLEAKLLRRMPIVELRSLIDSLAALEGPGVRPNYRAGTIVDCQAVANDAHVGQDTEWGTLSAFDQDRWARSGCSTEAVSIWKAPYDTQDERFADEDGDWDVGAGKTEGNGAQALTGLSASADGLFTPHSALFENWYRTPASTPSEFETRSLKGADDVADWGPGDWDPGFVKAGCALGQEVAGISQNQGPSRILCRTIASTVANDDSKCAPVLFSISGDARLYTGSGDWAPGYLKVECKPTQIMKGVSTNSAGGLHGILCCDI